MAYIEIGGNTNIGIPMLGYAYYFPIDVDTEYNINSIGINWAGSQAGFFRVAIFDRITLTCGDLEWESDSIAMTEDAGWQYVDLSPTLIPSSRYKYIGLQISAAKSLYHNVDTCGFKAYAYGPFPAHAEFSYYCSDVWGPLRFGFNTRLSVSASGDNVVVLNPSFERPSIPSYEYHPAGTSWSFSPIFSGIQHSESPWGFVNQLSAQTAFIQLTGSFYQAITFPVAGGYKLTIWAEQRSPNRAQGVSIRIDDVEIAQCVPPYDYVFTKHEYAFTINTAGDHELEFVGLPPPDIFDCAMAIDLITISSIESYPVTYDANGATSGTAPDSQTKTKDITLVLRTNTGGLVKTGYTFSGWNTSADGSGTDYAEGADYTDNAEVTLYAKWTLITYPVIYNANEATSGTIPDSQAKIKDVTLVLRTNTGNLAKTGYTFPGWYTASDTYASTLIARNPLSYWRLGELSGIVAGDEMGLHNGAYVNSPLLGQAGPVQVNDGNLCAKFTGTQLSYDGKYCRIPAGTSYCGLSTMVMEFWVKFTQYDIGFYPDAGLPLISKWAVANWSQDSYIIQTYYKRISAVIAGNSGAYGVNQINELQLNQWYYVVIVFKNNTLYLYIDNELQGSVVIDSSTIKSTTTDLCFGHNDDHEHLHLNGFLDEVAVYDYDWYSDLVNKDWYNYLGETDYAEGADYTINAAATMYAKWVVDTYPVTYNANGATSGTIPAPQTKIYGITLTLADNIGVLTRTHYIFIGWNTSADGSGTFYLENSDYTANTAATMYAMWALLPSDLTKRYYVGGPSVSLWNDSTNWSTSSGGPGGASLPDSTTTVIFDHINGGLCALTTDASVGGIYMLFPFDGTLLQNNRNINVAREVCCISGSYAGSGRLYVHGPLTMRDNQFNSPNELHIYSDASFTQGFNNNDNTVVLHSASKISGEASYSTVDVQAGDGILPAYNDGTFSSRYIILSSGNFQQLSGEPLIIKKDVTCLSNYGSYSSRNNAVLKMDSTGEQHILSYGIIPALTIDKTNSNQVMFYGGETILINRDFLFQDGTVNLNGHHLQAGL